MSGLELRLIKESWPRKKAMRITGFEFSAVDVIHVIAQQDGRAGHGEAAGIYYRNESPERLAEQIATLPTHDLDRARLPGLLPPGGARNALDCALWDLQAKLERKPVWKLAGLAEPRALTTTFTCSADTPGKMAEEARSFTGARAIKLKLVGDGQDRTRVKAVREAVPQASMVVDANQGFTRQSLDNLMPALEDCDVRLIEQPFPADRDEWLDGLCSPIPIAADESLQDEESVARLVGRVQYANIKLDKCGGLTTGLKLAALLRRHGIKPMVGSMGGTSLAMAPAFLVGQSCEVVDLDGAALIRSDRESKANYEGGLLYCSEQVWGGPE
jgi:L-alanine-DL-glutamate epimerase-like enolase superfamily enzyme